MKIDVITPDQLTNQDTQQWLRFLDLNPSLESAYFRPEFAEAVGRVRPQTRIAVISDDDQTLAFFSYEQQGRQGRPLCGRLSDFQAIIAPPTFRIEPEELVRGCGLNVWDFDHLLVSHREFAPYREFIDGSPYIDLSDGFERYLKRRKELGDNELKQTQRKARKMVRELGPLRLVDFDPDSDCPENLSLLSRTIQWKSEQYRNSRITNVFAYPWTGRLMQDLLRYDSPAFRGRLTALFAGSHLVATHLGMESNGVLHYWFPAYDTAHSVYSPGRVLMLEICRRCRELGVRRIDLGRGMADFKTRVMTGVAQVAVGSVDLRPLTRTLRRTWQSTRDIVKSSPILHYPAKAPGRVLYRLREWMAFQ